MRRPHYPLTPKVSQVENYHGTEVSDPYRWLEDELSTERSAWIEAQNATTAAYLSRAPVRDTLQQRFDALLRYPRYYDLIRRGPYIFFRRNEGLQNQLTLCAQRGLSGTPEILVDPHELEPDGTIQVTGFLPSKDARYLAYGLSNAGSDWHEYFVRDMTTTRDLPDRLKWVKCTALAWKGNGLCYSRFREPSDQARALSERNRDHQVWYHRLGTPQQEDTSIYEDPAHPFRIYFLHTSEDERFAILDIFNRESEDPGNALLVLDWEKGSTGFRPLAEAAGSTFRFVASQDDRLLVLTNHDAPNWRLILIDPAHRGPSAWEELIPERVERLEFIRPVGGKLFGIYRSDAAHRLCVFDSAGRPDDEVPLPGIGIVRCFEGQCKDTELLWSFTSFTVPTAIYQYSILNRASTIFYQPTVPFRSSEYETTRAFYPSKDGTPIPMFIVHKVGLNLDGNHPCVLEGYGAEGMAVWPSFDPLLCALLERGVIYALACLRGGGEYGEAWHQAAWRETKQTSFTDCIAAAEWLQANGYTNHHQCALMGASNGGLLVGAVMTQRPDLFKVALPSGGVMDMLRFHKFTTGWTATTEYGSSEEAEMFPILLSYSPLHNIKQGVSYPATLVVASEHDDRVVPAHSFKFVATLQDLGAGPNPYLIRIETRSGHSAISLPKIRAERADVYAFLLTHITDRMHAPDPRDGSGPNTQDRPTVTNKGNVLKSTLCGAVKGTIETGIFKPLVMGSIGFYL